MADDVRLTDLQLIQRYSIAVRGETADRAELIAALRADLTWLQGGSGRSASDRAAKPARKAAAKPAKRAPAKVAKPARRAR
ncbi:MAG TPA: hypothetical protein VNA14_07290 [Mycobacteriales bacterium]|nr:hypothetical protein [Mycobacteriales bacterium]